MSITVAQGLPERLHHVLGNLWIKIAGWLKRSTNSRDWQIWWTGCGFPFRSRTAPGAIRVLLGATFGSFTKLKRRISRDWFPSHCLFAICFARYLVHVALFFFCCVFFFFLIRQYGVLLWAIVACVGIGLPSSKWLMEGGLWWAVSLQIPPLGESARPQEQACSQLWQMSG